MMNGKNFILAVMMMVIMFLACPIGASAEEPVTSSLYFKGWTQNNSQRSYVEESVSGPGYIFAYLTGEVCNDGYGDYRYFTFAVYDPDTGVCKNLISSNFTASDYAMTWDSATYPISNGVVSDSTSWHQSATGDISHYRYVHQVSSLLDSVEYEGYVFQNMSSAKAYFENGNETGLINAPEKVYDFNTAHDFKKDVYTADIPVPHLTHLSYYGFEVDNAKSGRYIDMYVTSQFYGVKHDKSAEYSYSIDSSNLVNSHRYNFTISDAAYDGYLVNIEDMYGVSLLDDLTEDFKSWSSAHPSHKTLSDYSFISHMAGFWESNYLGHHTYANNVYTSDRDKTNYSNQAVVTYYVRFYQVIDGELKYGRWASYSYSRSSPTVTNLSIGDVEATETGEPVQVNAYSGMQDSAGNFTFHNPSSDSSTGSSMLDAADLWATINGLVSGMGSIPDLLHAVFIFMPSWLLKMISAGIAAIIVLRFVGR